MIGSTSLVNVGDVGACDWAWVDGCSATNNPLTAHTLARPPMIAPEDLCLIGVNLWPSLLMRFTLHPQRH